MEPVYTVYIVYTVCTMYYHDTLIKSTKIQALCTLKIPFDIVSTLFSTVVVTQFNLCKIHVFINMVITRVKNASPDMILTAFA